MMEKTEVKVGDRVSTWNLGMREYEGCEFTPIMGTPQVEITKVPERKPEVPDEPMTRGAVVTFEGHDECVAVRFTDADDLPYPFVAAISCTGTADVFCWDEIVTHAAGRKIIVHKTADPTKVPLSVETYEEWLEIPSDERKKYKWRDVEGDIWRYDFSRGTFIPDYDLVVYDYDIKEYFPLIRDEKIG